MIDIFVNFITILPIMYALLQEYLKLSALEPITAASQASVVLCSD